MVNTVKKILELLREQSIIPEHALTNVEAELDSPKDMRYNVVYELLSTERKYVQDLEALQVQMLNIFMIALFTMFVYEELYERSTSTRSTFTRHNALFIWKFECTC